MMMMMMMIMIPNVSNEHVGDDRVSDNACSTCKEGLHRPIYSLFILLLSLLLLLSLTAWSNETRPVGPIGFSSIASSSRFIIGDNFRIVWARQ